jgi:hypothetical protein
MTGGESQAGQSTRSMGAAGRAMATNRAVQMRRVSRLTGMEVKNPEGQDLGDIEDFAIDTSDGHVVFDGISRRYRRRTKQCTRSAGGPASGQCHGPRPDSRPADSSRSCLSGRRPLPVSFPARPVRTPTAPQNLVWLGNPRPVDVVSVGGFAGRRWMCYSRDGVVSGILRKE